jgi:hypothetical protein
VQPTEDVRTHRIVRRWVGPHAVVCQISRSAELFVVERYRKFAKLVLRAVQGFGDGCSTSLARTVPSERERERERERQST